MKTNSVNVSNMDNLQKISYSFPEDKYGVSINKIYVFYTVGPVILQPEESKQKVPDALSPDAYVFSIILNQISWRSDKLVAAYDSGLIYIWNMKNGDYSDNSFYPRNKMEITTAALNSDGSKVILGFGDGMIVIFDTKTHEIVQRFRYDGSVRYETGHYQDVSCTTWSPDEKYIISGDRSGKSCIWNVNNGECLSMRYDPKSSSCNSVAHHPKKELIASGFDDGKVCIYTAETWDIPVSQRHRPSQDITAIKHPKSVNVVEWCGENILAAGSDDRRISLTEIEIDANGLVKNTKLKRVIKLGLGCVKTLAWNNEGLLASGCSANAINIWNISTGMRVKTFPEGDQEGHSDDVTTVVWNGKMLASASDDNTIKISQYTYNQAMWDAAKDHP